ncbi:MAG: ABC transporter permease [Spirochaetaceae bacterium]|nr:MAG: ABC transporter permease [Spirochaetaceae bacterium]
MRRAGRVGELFAGTLGLLITLGISFLIAIVLIFLLSSRPLTTIYYFFVGPFTNKYYFGNMLNTAIPLVFTGLGMAVAFKSSVFNLGGEGQVYSGALVATVILLALPERNGYLGGPTALAAALVTGAVLAGMSGLFKMKWGTDELISSFLISSAVIFVVNYFITGPLDDPSNSMLATHAIGSQYRLLGIFPPSKLDISAVFAVLAAVLVFFLMYYTHWGYEMRMCGLNREFSRYGGINVSTYVVLPMVISGALHGLAGGITIMGTYYLAVKEFSYGMGWNGIAVALIAKNNPLGVLPAAVFFAYLDAGAKAAMLHSDVTFEIAAIVQAVIFYLITAQAIYDFLRYRKRPRI